MCDLPPDAYDDCFHPPSIPTHVFCLHCQEIYDSYLIEWREEGPPTGRRGFWRCPTPGCDGAGFGFDIHPIDPDYIDPDGRDMGEWCDDEWCDDEGDEEDWCDDDPLIASNALDPPDGEREDIDASEQFDRDESSTPSLSEIEEAAGLEPSLTGPSDTSDAFAIPMDDLLPENTAIDLPDLTPEEMMEIERKLGWCDESGCAGPDASSDDRATPPPHSPSSHEDRDWIDDDDIPI